MPELALILWGAFFVFALAGRVAVQLVIAGSTGLVGIGGTAGAAEWIGGVIFIGSLVAGLLAMILQLDDAIEPIDALNGSAGYAIGIGLFALGLAGTVWSQLAMGRSWRFGVPEEPTELITGGPFGLVRNPIYTAVITTVAGLALLTPNVLAVAALAGLVVGFEVHVRASEEPQLRRAHNDTYPGYAARVGRFVPGIGRIRAGS
jgi:protein-S-isoprenylcysteine O-methyltransferase Ste14